MNLGLLAALVGFLVAFLTGCGSTSTTKITEYDAQGNIVRITETTSDASDFTAYLASGKDNATDLRGDISKFNLGWNGYGLNWLSISGGRTKAPVNNKSNSAETLTQMATVIRANKTTIEAGELGVNTEAKTEATKQDN